MSVCALGLSVAITWAYVEKLLIINKIKTLKKRKDFVNRNRFNSMPCPIQGLNNPRDCYVNSGYTCKWSETADRCNEIN